MQKRANNRFLDILWSLVCSTGLILHILVDTNDTQVLMVMEMLGRVINYAQLAYLRQKKEP